MLLDSGNAYKMDGDTLLSAPILVDGTVEDNWTEVDFYSIDARRATYCMYIRAALVAKCWRR